MATSNEKTELTIRSISVAWLVKALVVKYAPEFSDSVDWVTYFKSEGEARRQLSSEIKNKLKEVSPAYHKDLCGAHHHHKSGGAAVAAGIIGGAIVGAVIAESLKPDPVVVTPAPVVVPQPVVVQQSVVVAQPVTQVQNVWVEGRYVHRRDAHGRMIRVWEPGHYEQRTVTITP